MTLHACDDGLIRQVQRGFAHSARAASKEEPTGKAQPRSHIAAATHEGPDTATSQSCSGAGSRSSELKSCSCLSKLVQLSIILLLFSARLTFSCRVYCQRVQLPSDSRCISQYLNVHECMEDISPQYLSLRSPSGLGCDLYGLYGSGFLLLIPRVPLTHPSTRSRKNSAKISCGTLAQLRQPQPESLAHAQQCDLLC